MAERAEITAKRLYEIKYSQPPHVGEMGCWVMSPQHVAAVAEMTKLLPFPEPEMVTAHNYLIGLPIRIDDAAAEITMDMPRRGEFSPAMVPYEKGSRGHYYEPLADTQ